MNYYVIRSGRNLPVAGSFFTAFRAASFIATLPDAGLYYVASRYELVKQGLYPRRKSEEARLAADLVRGKATLPSDLPPPLSSRQANRLCRRVIGPEQGEEVRQAAARLLHTPVVVRQAAAPARLNECTLPGPEKTVVIGRVHVHPPASHLMLSLAPGIWVEVNADDLAGLEAGHIVTALLDGELSGPAMEQYAGYLEIRLAATRARHS